MFYLDLNNIDVEKLMKIIKIGRDYKLEYNEISSNFYEINYNIDIYSRNNSVIIPNVLFYEDYVPKIQNKLTTLITDNIYRNSDDFIKRWIDKESINEVSFNIKTSLNINSFNELENQVKLFNNFKEFCINIEEILGFISCIFDFYKDNENEILCIDRNNIQFLKKIKIHNYDFEQVIRLFENKNKILTFNTRVVSYNRNLHRVRFTNQTIFKTFDLNFFKEHKGLQILTFIENL